MKRVMCRGIKLAKIGNTNRRKGFGYEYRFVQARIKEGCIDVKRHYGSLGVTDVDWIDAKGQKHSAQLKFSTIRIPKISRAEYVTLYKHAMNNRDIKIWLVCKLSRKEELWEEIKL